MKSETLPKKSHAVIIHHQQVLKIFPVSLFNRCIFGFETESTNPLPIIPYSGFDLNQHYGKQSHAVIRRLLKADSIFRSAPISEKRTTSNLLHLGCN
ncbi:hypothetical protein [Cypionkella sp.]|uniref:hypothetical protein n=1 Tax=Cypionkella sp. TaxID=2811411 RepID=UPI002610D756|nr:hypothetical protein [Cypionkella sp.]